MVKVKQVNVTANYAWSPAELHPIQLATATAAQQLDATFSTSANLSLYSVDLADSSKELKLAGQVDIPTRFYKVIWGNTGYESSTGESKGLIVCGADNGLINIYDPTKLIDNTDSEAALVNTNNKHTGPVKALDFNPFQKNLYASGATDSEIFIWDLKNPSNPMTPGKKTEPLASISCVAWNRQVQHILGSSTSVTSGPCCVVWDLRKNAPIIKVSDPSGRMQCSEIAWHPEVATQLVLASEDDRSPVVQLWDLRFANSPLRALENHHRGVLSVAWCQQDPDLLLSCGKDNRVLCWNPNTTPPEILYEMPSAAQWCFDVQWCPRNPAMVSMGSFDGHISIHSMMGGSTYTEMPSKQQQDALAESFGGNAFASAPDVHQPQSPKKVISMPLKKPPKWICKPCGSTFSFGGKLVTFESTKPSNNEEQQVVRRTVTIHQVVTENDFITRSEELQTALSSTQYADYCQKKLESASSVFEEDLWSFMKAKFESEPRKQFLHLLGYDVNKIRAKITSLIGAEEEEKLATKMDDLSTSIDSADTSQSGEGAEAFELIAANKSAESIKSTTESPMKPLVIPSGDTDPDSLISQALLVGDYESAVNLCLRENRMADAIVLAIAGGPQLLERTQKAYFSRCTSKIGRLMLAVATKNWAEIVRSCDLGNWKEALATLLTYSNKEEMNALCDELGERLEANPEQKIHACLCYVCSGNVERLVRCWDSVAQVKDTEKATPEALQDLIEKVMVLRKAVEGMVGLGIGHAAAEKLSSYASILASQGKLEAALGYLPDSVEKPEIQLLRERLRYALGVQQQQQQNYQRQQYSRGTTQQQPGYRQPGYVQPVQPQPTFQPMQNQSQQPVVPDSAINNPYSANRRIQPKPGYTASAPGNLYIPQQPTTTSGAPNTMNGYSPAMASAQPFAPQNYNLMTPTQPISAPAPLAPGMQPGFPQPMQPGMAPVSAPNYIMQPNGPPGAPVGAQAAFIETPVQTVTEENDNICEPQAPAPSLPTSAAKDVPKAPIPQEHQILHTHFDNLIKQCLAQASNAQTKRKLEDCERRMEFLYDKLRANTLSPHIVTGLHQVAQFVSAHDYASGLRQHTQIVSSSNFSEISAFMPGLKSMLQIASQMRV
uniref:protein transport protein Sec31A-like isoform X1 n=1 Tax=Styela clava TaxID=7725 RepID=UPI00193A9BF8|nr:protein transport protein Sec31A-like isoform X1 [Styela clava]